MNRPRIALISEHASPLAMLGGADSGGQNVYVGQLALWLGKFGYEVDVFTRRDCPDQPAITMWGNNVRIVHVPAGPAGPVRKEELLPYMGEFADFVIRCHRGRRRYDLVHANFFMSALVGAELKRAACVPLVVTFHALGRVRQRHQGGEDGFPAERLEIEDRVVARSRSDHRRMPAGRGRSGAFLSGRPVCAGDDSVRIRPGGVLAHGEGKGAHRVLGLDPNEHIILQLGRMVPRKGVDNVIRGVSRLRSRHGLASRLLIVGGESETPDPGVTPEIGRLRSIAAAEGVANAVTFVGSRGRDLLRYYIARPTCSSRRPGTSRLGLPRSRPPPAARRWWARRWAASKQPSWTARLVILFPTRPGRTGRSRGEAVARSGIDPADGPAGGPTGQCVFYMGACRERNRTRVYENLLAARTVGTRRRVQGDRLFSGGVGAIGRVMVPEEVEWR